ncbi:sporulation protein [Planococcus sp. FY231025]|uniref:sporulation protein n=1 Tax=Planococcus sp. FY231025 TaxID=3455699 RepID=UPI003F92E897
MNFKKFLSSIGIGSLTVETVVERPNLNEGETLNGTIYITGGDSDQKIEYVELHVVKQIDEVREDSDFQLIENVVAKQSLDFVSTLKSKGSLMQQFEIVPDERWIVENTKTKLLLRTIVHVDNGVDAVDEDEFTYSVSAL